MKTGQGVSSAASLCAGTGACVTFGAGRKRRDQLTVLLMVQSMPSVL